METMVKIGREFWLNKRVLVTGHTGFKGGWLTLWLEMLGAHVLGVALPPQSVPNLFEKANIAQGIESHYCDIRDFESLKALVHKFKPQVVFHLAAQPLVRASYRDPLGTFSSNIMGTANVLDSLKGLESVQVSVMVTTDKVYKNQEHFYPYREEDPLGGHDPYSASKAASEIVISSYRDAILRDQGVAVASARAGNVIGGGDWSEDRLIPDAIRAWQVKETLEIRRPQAIRPWQHVTEPLAAYLSLAEKLWNRPELAGPYNFGPLTQEAANVKNVIEIARQVFGQSSVKYTDDNTGPHEANWLALETAKARELLNIHPKWHLRESIVRTVTWYKNEYAGADARKLCTDEIEQFESTFVSEPQL